MLTHRSHVYDLALSASAEAVDFAMLLATHIAANDDRSPMLHGEARMLQDSINQLLSALPKSIGEGSYHSDCLMRHMWLIHHRLEQNQPRECLADPIDMVRSDIPGVLELYDEWYKQQSLGDSELSSRIEPFIKAGQLNAALREAWPVFKTRMVMTFGLSDALDGHNLAEALFGPEGATAKDLEEGERQGYLNLLKGLYTLYRNPVSHNDIQNSPQEVDSVLVMLDAILARVTGAESQGKE